MSDVQLDLLNSSPSPYIELVQMDISFLGLYTTVLYLTPGMNSDNTKIVFGSQEYDPWPFMVEGIAQSSDGAPARPTITFGNLDANKFIGTLAFKYSDIIGATVLYIRTFAEYLGGSGTISAAKLKYTIGKKAAHNNKLIQFELRSPLDKERAYLPARPMLKRDFPGLGSFSGMR